MAKQYHETSPMNPIRYFLDKPVAANLLMFLIIIGGIMSLLDIQRRNMPEMKFDFFGVHVPVNSGSAEDVERTIVSKIEEEISSIDGIEEVTSSASANLGSVIIKVADGYEMKDVREEVKTTVDAISTFPADAERPYIFEIDSQAAMGGGRVLRIDISGQRSLSFLEDKAEELRLMLLDNDEITQVEIGGVVNEEISIEVSEQTLRNYGLTMDQVVTAVRNNSVDRTGGTLKQDSGFMQLRVRKEKRNGEDFATIPVLNLANGQQVLLGDIATIKDGYIESLGISKFNGTPTVFITLKNSDTQDILKLKDAAVPIIQKFQEQAEQDLTITTWSDETIYLKERLQLVTKNGLMGLALVLILLSLFLDLRLAFWVALGIPIAFTGAIMLMPMGPFDASINFVSTFGFLVALGIVVDDAIIVAESVYTSVERHGEGTPAVFFGANKVAVATTFGVLTTMAAFTPLLILEGVFGQILGEMGIVVILCLLFSLIESKLILPSHLRHIKQADPNATGPWRNVQNAVARGLKRFIDNVYLPFVQKAVRYRYLTLAAFISALILTVSMVGGQVKSSFFPSIEDNRMRISVTMEEGTPYAVTYKAIDRLEESLIEAVAEFTNTPVADTNIDTVIQNIAYTSDSDTSISGRVELKQYQGKEISPSQFAKIWSRKFGSVPGVKSLNLSGDGGPVSTDIEVQLEARSLEDLQSATQVVEESMFSYSEVIEVRNDLLSAQPELQFTTNALARSLGLNEGEIIRQVRQAVFGAEVQRIQRGRNETRVYVRYPESERSSLALLDNLRIRTNQGQEVPLSELVTYELAPGVSSIRRVDGRRAVKLNASINDQSRLDAISAGIKAKWDEEISANFPNVELTLDGQAKEQAKAASSMLVGMGISMFMIFALLAIPLNSYSKPLVIISVIPFSVIGMIIGHYITGLPISLSSFLGTLALFGVVVNDSLVLTTTINYYQEKGQALKQAIETAAKERFRPILLTSLTTFAGLAPMLLETSIQSQFLKPMAVALAFGILFATMITLVLVPVIFRILADIRPSHQDAMIKEDIEAPDSVWV